MHLSMLGRRGGRRGKGAGFDEKVYPVSGEFDDQYSPGAQNKDIQKCIFLLKVRKGFFQSAMFLASALKRGSHPPENILKI